jgi:fatty acid desaturase
MSLSNLWHEEWFQDGMKQKLDADQNAQMLRTKKDFGRMMHHSRRFVRHQFSVEILSEIAQFNHSNNYSGILRVLDDWCIVFCCIIFTLFAYDRCHIFLSALCYLSSVVVIGARQRSIEIKLHSAAHASLASNCYLNIVLGTIFSGYTVFQSLSLYTQTHVKEHHPWVGNPFRDPDYQGFIQYKICGAYRSSATTAKYMWNIFSVSNSLQYIQFVIKNRIYNRSQNWVEFVVRITYWLLLLSIVAWLNLWCILVLFWFVPFLTTHLWISCFLELCEHFPMVDISSESLEYKDIYLTKNRLAGPLSNWFLGIHGEGYDLIHHLFPALPTWNYPAVHHILMRDREYQKLDHGRDGWLHIAKQILLLSDL